ncbi:MAG TPA: OmpA family protein [Thermoanaerobaculia bacterium]|nr:OmpA family protein [Thermoanaerobaculia bacterium]
MSKKWKVFFCGIAIISFVLAAACHTTKKPVVQPQQATMDTAPAVPPVAVTAPTPVQTNTDFVKTDTEPQVTEAPLPSNLEDLNRVAQERGLIRDAFFGYDESTLSADAQSALSTSARWLNGEGRAYNILIEGHCDERGTEQYNLALGDKRANVAKEYLQTLAVDASRIRTVSYGEERPFDPGHDESAWAKNRRAHLVIVGK